MSHDHYVAIDRYLDDRFAPEDAVLQAAVARSAAAGLPAIQVSPGQGKLLYTLARMVGARRILEIGTLGGYSTIWLARALPADGRLISLEYSAQHADVARENLAAAGLADIVNVRVGAAAASLKALIAEQSPAFDLIFLDADKASYPEYLQLVLDLVRPGALIVADNITRGGRLLQEPPEPDSIGMRRFLDDLAAEPRLTSAAFQTVGLKGHDGMAIAVVTT